ncbi:low choriolytic enzyme-like [Neosynchiropus ocellatus]
MNNGSSELMLEGDVLIPKKRNAMRCYNQKYSCLWPKSRFGTVDVPFTLSSGYDDAEREEILSAMREFETKTCVRFRPRVAQRAYLRIKPQQGCASLLGYVGDAQTLSLQRFGCIRRGIIQHELLHALGFYHEHTRSDRDQHVKILWDNLHPYFAYNFNKKNTNNLNTPYDYSSVMHYGRNAFGINGAQTMVPIPDASVPIGQREGMSDIDVLRVNRLYKCWQ